MKFGLISLFTLGLAVAACTVKRPTLELGWKDDQRAVRAWAERSRVKNYSCYFASITGAGVPEDYSAGELGTRDPKCMGFGINSRTLSLNDIEKVGVKFNIPAGPSRTIRIFGAVSSLADCSGKSVGDLFNGLRPAIYELGKVEQDIFFGKKIIVSASPTVDSATDVVAPCDSKTDPSLPVSTNGQLWVLYTDTSLNFRLRRYAFTDGVAAATGEDFVVTTTAVSALTLAPDARTLYAHTLGGNSAQVYRYDVDPQASLAYQYQSTLLDGIEHLGFYDYLGSYYAYAAKGSAFRQYNVNPTEWDPITDYEVCPQTVDLFFRLGSFIYRTNGIALAGGDFPYGDICTGRPINGVLRSPVKFMLNRNEKVYFATSVPPYSIEGYTWNDKSGALTLLGFSNAGPGLVTGVAMSADGKYIFSSNDQSLNTTSIDGDGRPVSTFLATVDSLSSPRNLVVSAGGKYLYLTSSTGSVLRYTIGQDGRLTEGMATALGLLVEGQVLSMVYVPIF